MVHLYVTKVGEVEYSVQDGECKDCPSGHLVKVDVAIAWKVLAQP